MKFRGMPVQHTQKYALVILIKEIMAQLDAVAQLKAKGSRAVVSEQILQEMCSVLRDLGPELQKMYFDLLLVLVPSSGKPHRTGFTEDYAMLVREAKFEFLDQVRSDLNLKVA